MGRVYGDEQFVDIVEEILLRESGSMGQFPSAFGRLLSVLTTQMSPPLEIVVLGHPEDSDARDMVREAFRRYAPNRVLVGGDPALLPSLPILEGRAADEGSTTAYVCRNFTCSLPLLSGTEMRELLDQR